MVPFRNVDHAARHAFDVIDSHVDPLMKWRVKKVARRPLMVVPEYRMFAAVSFGGSAVLFATKRVAGEFSLQFTLSIVCFVENFFRTR
jgi:hypothetical protein